MARTPTTAIPCTGCGGRVPDVPGVTHPYIVSSPGCWAIYGELLAERLSTLLVSEARGVHHVDCYAAQHPGGAERDRRQRQSVAVHLLTLCLTLEFGLTPAKATRTRGRASRILLPSLGLDDWPALDAPERRGRITIVDVAAADGRDLPSVVSRWGEDVWQAWSAQHGTVRGWARTVVDGQ